MDTAGGRPNARTRDAGLARAYEAAGGVTALARAMGTSHQRLSRLKSCPKWILFPMAAASGVEAATIRPDLADWIAAEEQRLWLDRARARFASASGLGTGIAHVRREVRADPETLDLLDLGLIVAAARFAARERGLTVPALMAASREAMGGAPTPARSARAYAMALAVVVGRVSSVVVAPLFGVSRQAVENAAERYLRSRDGDEAEAGARVVERGRERRAKSADAALWDAERRFVAGLAGDA